VDETRIAIEAWIERYCRKTGSPSCTGIFDQTVRLCVDIRSCHPGVLLFSPDRDVQAFFTGGTRPAPGASPAGFDFYNGKLVVIRLWRAESDPSVARYGGGRRLVEAFLSTMCVYPQDLERTYGCG
jgi:hypothetical protein